MSALTIPFERQETVETDRGCGAACLSMVYKSFGKDIPQAEIWPLIAKQNRFGSVASITHLMALHAIQQGLSSIVIQARHPLHVLRLCREANIPAILNHRPQAGAANGHYTVLVDVDRTSVVLHDPSSGPARRISHDELLRLWQPQSANSEILGNVIIGFSAGPKPVPACEFCHTAIPAKVDCPNCGKAVGLGPATLLGCIREGCIARMWNCVACPCCDYVWTFNEAGAPSTGPAPVVEPDEKQTLSRPQSLDHVLAELDKFCAHLLAIPGASQHADLTAQFDFIRAGKEKLKLAQMEELAVLQARVNRFAAFAAKSKKAIEENRRAQEELNAPPPPLDGNALNAALLKNLGFR